MQVSHKILSRGLFELPSLDNATLDLSQLLDLEVLPHRDEEEARDQEAGRGDGQVPLSDAVGIDDRSTLGGTDGVGKLSRKRAIQLRIQGRVSRQSVAEGLGELLGIDGCRDGLADGTADGREDTDESEHGGDVLVGCSGHDGHFLADDEGAAAEGNEDLAHDDPSDSLMWLPEMDHETDSEDFEAEHGHGEPLEATELADHESEDYRPEAGSDAVNVCDVAGVRDGKTVDCLQVVVEVGIPDAG